MNLHDSDQSVLAQSCLAESPLDRTNIIYRFMTPDDPALHECNLVDLTHLVCLSSLHPCFLDKLSRDRYDFHSPRPQWCPMKDCTVLWHCIILISASFFMCVSQCAPSLTGAIFKVLRRQEAISFRLATTNTTSSINFKSLLSSLVSAFYYLFFSNIFQRHLHFQLSS